MKKDSLRPVVLFGEAEKGDFQFLFRLNSLAHLAETLGHPPEGSLGLHLGIQTLLFDKELIFIRVKEEGFSIKDYWQGFSLLKKHSLYTHIGAIGLPGVGDSELLAEAFDLCHHSGALLMTTEKDFYDYLTYLKIS